MYNDNHGRQGSQPPTQQGALHSEENIMNAQEFFAAAQNAGFTIVENKYGYRFTAPNGDTYFYKGLQAVQFGTWMNEQTYNEEPLPTFTK